MIVKRTDSHGNTRYLVRIEAPGSRRDDRRRITVGTFDKLREAEEEERKALVQRDEGALVAGDRSIVDALMQRWLAVKQREVDPNTYTDYKGVIANHIRPAIGDLALRDVAPATIYDLYERWHTAGMSGSLMKQCHVCLTGSFTMAIGLRLITRSPLESVKTPRVTKGTVGFWNVAEARSFLEAATARNTEWAHRQPVPLAVWSLLLREGVRRSEMLGLRWRDVDLANGTIHITQTVVADKSQGGKAVVRQKGKTDASRRTVRLTPESRKHLQAMPKPHLDDDLVFRTKRGTPINPTTITRAFHAIIDKAIVDGKPLRRIRLHDMRHTSATLMFKERTPVKVVQERLGHSSASTTLDLYGHVLPDMQEQAVDALSRLLREPDA